MLATAEDCLVVSAPESVMTLPCNSTSSIPKEQPLFFLHIHCGLEIVDKTMCIYFPFSKSTFNTNHNHKCHLSAATRCFYVLAFSHRYWKTLLQIQHPIGVQTPPMHGTARLHVCQLDKWFWYSKQSRLCSKVDSVGYDVFLNCYLDVCCEGQWQDISLLMVRTRVWGVYAL